MPVGFFPWQSGEEELRLVRKKLGRLVNQRVRPEQVIPSNAVKLYTIRSFKGLEADIVFLTGVREGSQACTLNDIYVGCSRARFLLTGSYTRGRLDCKSRMR